MIRNTHKPRSPGKIRARREHLSAFFNDEIPTRDESSPAIPRRASAGAPHSHRQESRSISPIQRQGSEHSGTQVTPSLRTVSEDKMSMHDISTSKRSVDDYLEYIITPVTARPNVMASTSTEALSVVSRNIYNLWQNQQLCDVRIIAGGRQFLAHKLVMAVACGVFTKDEKDHPTNILAELEISDVSAEAMNDVLKFFYTQRLHVSEHNVDSLLKIAKELDIRIIIEKCKDYLKEVNLKNVLQNRYIAHKYSLLDITANIDEYFKQNFLEFTNTAAFLQCDFQQVYDILLSDRFVSGSELEMFHACASWIDFNRQERLNYAVPLMSLIRFIHILPEKIVSEVEPVQCIFEIPECKHMLYEAFKHHALMHECMTTPITARTGPGLTRPITARGKPSMTMPATTRSLQDQQHHVETTFSSTPDMLMKVRSSSSSKQTATPTSQTISTSSIPRPHSAHSVRSTKDELSISRSTSSNEEKDVTELPAPPGLHIALVLGGLNSFELEESGLNTSSGISQVVQQYEPATNSWSGRTTMPLPLHHCGVASVEGYVYVVGGTLARDQNNVMEVTAECHRYDVVNNTWSSIGRMLTPRSEHVALVLNNVIYAVGGVDNQGHSLSSMEFYKVEEDKWYYTHSMNDMRVGLAATGHAGQVFVVGGTTGMGEGCLLDGVESYAPTTNKWTQRSNFPLPLCHGSLIDINGALYHIGGYVTRDGDNILSLDNIFRYRDDVDVWEPFTSLHIPRHDAVAVSLGTRLYVIGGISSATIGHALSNVECFDVETHDRMEGIAPLPTPAYGLCGCVVSWGF